MKKERIERLAGYEKEKAEILQLRKMLHDFEKYRSMGIRIPRGLLISGEPGIGKTEMMRSLPDKGIKCFAVEKEEDSDFIGDAFEKAVIAAKKNAPAVIMIDEFDKIAGGLDLIFSGKKNEVSTAFIKSMDLLTNDDAVLIVATCNNMRDLAPSLLRTGRFDRIMEMHLPDDQNRTRVASKYLKSLKIPKKITADYISKITYGMSCADIQSIINDAAIIAAEREEPCLSPNDFRVAINRRTFNGAESLKEHSRDEDYKTAVHEAGHALVALKTAPESLYEASILEQGNSSGHIQVILDDSKCMSAKDIENDIRISLAGHVAEREVLGEYMVGSESDLVHSTEMLLHLIVNNSVYGYEFLTTHPGFRDSGLVPSDSLKFKRDMLFSSKMTQLDNDATKIIRENREFFNALVENLIEKKVLTADEIKELEKSFEKTNNENTIL